MHHVQIETVIADLDNDQLVSAHYRIHRLLGVWANSSHLLRQRGVKVEWGDSLFTPLNSVNLEVVLTIPQRLQEPSASLGWSLKTVLRKRIKLH